VANLACGCLLGPGFAAASDTLAEQAQAAYDRKDYQRGAELYRATVEAGVQGADAPYNAACCFARAGKKREAMTIGSAN
jgi:carboxyl-terminal processing protease